MIKVSQFLAELTEEVCKADYLSLRMQEKDMLEMASHKAPVPGEGYLRYMAANEIDIEISLKKKTPFVLKRLIDWIFRRQTKNVYSLCSKKESEVSLKITFRRPASSPLVGEKNKLSGMYASGQPLEKDWETETYVVN